MRAHIFIQRVSRVRAQTLVAEDGKNEKKRSSDGNLVNVGNFDTDGANVNRNDPRNANDNLGVSFSRSANPFFILLFFKRGIEGDFFRP